MQWSQQRECLQGRRDPDTRGHPQMCSGGSEVAPRRGLCQAHGEGRTVLLIALYGLTERKKNPPKPNKPKKPTHHETRWPTWSLNAFETKVSWGALQGKARCQVP